MQTQNQYFKSIFRGFIISSFFQSNAFAENGMLDWKPQLVLKISPRAETFKQTYITETPALLEKNSAESISFYSNSTDFMAILPLKEDFLFGPTFLYSNTALRYKSPAIPNAEKSVQLIKGGLDVTAIKILDEENFVLGQYNVTFANTKSLSFKSPKGQSGLVQWVHAFDADSCIGLGGVLYKSNGKMGALPLLGFGWRPVPEIQIDGWLPSFVFGTWHLTDSFFLLSRANALSDNYSSEDNSLFQPQNQINSNINITEYRITSGFGISFWGPLQLEVAVGTAVGRKIAATNAETNNVVSQKIKSPVLTRIQFNMKL